jgi:hypothetical protein
MNSSRGQSERWLTGAEGLQTVANVVAKQGDREEPKARWIRLQPTQSRLQEPLGSDVIFTLDMMKRCGHLNQALQDCLVRLECCEPHALP